MCIGNNTSCNLTLLARVSGQTNNIIGIRTTRGEVHAASGLNWGYNAGTAMLGDAYIPVNKNNILGCRNMFIKPNPNSPINVVWDDGTTMELLLEGSGANLNDGNEYPKQISSYTNKSILGDYLRRRIGNRIGRNLLYSQYAISELSRIKSRYSGDKNSIINAIRNNQRLFDELNDKFIKIDDLNQYGRTDISVSLVMRGNSQIYYFDFSV